MQCGSSCSYVLRWSSVSALKESLASSFRSGRASGESTRRAGFRAAEGWAQGGPRALDRRPRGIAVPADARGWHLLGGAARACRCPPRGRASREACAGLLPSASRRFAALRFILPEEEASSPRWERFPACPAAGGQGCTGGPSARCPWGCPSCAEGAPGTAVPCPSARCGGSAGAGEAEPGGSGCPRPPQPGPASASCPSGPQARRQRLAGQSQRQAPGS